MNILLLHEFGHILETSFEHVTINKSTHLPPKVKDSRKCQSKYFAWGLIVAGQCAGSILIPARICFI